MNENLQEQVTALEKIVQTQAQQIKDLYVLFNKNNFSALQVFTKDVVFAGKMTSKYYGIGYSIGSGGSVTQGTSKSTTVILDKATGQITMHNATLNSATIVSFTLTNKLIEAGDMLVINHISGGTIGAYTFNAQCAAGSATVNVRNASGSNLGEAIVLQIALLKGVIL